MPSYAQYSSGASKLGHYSTFQRSGEITATLGAGAHLARLRWAPSSTGISSPVCVPWRIKIGISVSAAVTDGRVEQAYRAFIARGFSVDFTTNMTSCNMTTVPKTNAMRSDQMAPSAMGASGPGIVTTGALSGQTMTVDSNPFCGCTLSPLLTATNSTGTATLLPQGTQAPMQTIYEATAMGQHAVCLNSNEGIIIQNSLAGYASGTFALYVQWEWMEAWYF